MTTALCPTCRQLRNLRASVATRTETGADGRRKRIETVSYHCEHCHGFVRSEEREVAQPGE